MNDSELNAYLSDLALSQSEFAALTGVSLRSVNLWATGRRTISEPAAAYLRLLHSVPRSFLTIEQNRIKGDLIMPEGMYLVEYGASAGQGRGTLILEKGVVFGADTERGKYDGKYGPSDKAGYTHLKMTVTIPAGVSLVQGFPAQPTQHSFEIEGDVPTAERASFNQQTPFGEVHVHLTKLRNLPTA